MQKWATNEKKKQKVQDSGKIPCFQRIYTLTLLAFLIFFRAWFWGSVIVSLVFRFRYVLFCFCFYHHEEASDECKLVKSPKLLQMKNISERCPSSIDSVCALALRYAFLSSSCFQKRLVELDH